MFDDHDVQLSVIVIGKDTFINTQRVLGLFMGGNEQLWRILKENKVFTLSCWDAYVQLSMYLVLWQALMVILQSRSISELSNHKFMNIPFSMSLCCNVARTDRSGQLYRFHR